MDSPSLSSKSCHAEYWIFPVPSAMIPEKTIFSSPLLLIFLASTDRIFPVTLTLPMPSRMSPIFTSEAERDAPEFGTLNSTPMAVSILPRFPMLICTLSFQSLQ